ncbi:MAG TPA: SDR family oxidoreductase [Candidatus Brocadiia bacterium]|nr:SDR family oxidoreductase [Candidatus Brocadiia bacterium]
MSEPTIRKLFDLTGRVALVTGGAGYLGRAMSSALAEAGARVVIASRNIAHCREAAAALDAISASVGSGAGHIAMQLDIDDEQAIRERIDEAVARAGRLDILINNAYGGPHPDIENATSEDFQKAFRTGLTSCFVASQQAHRHMKSQPHVGAAGVGATSGCGSIINIASMYGMVASYPDAYAGLPVNSPPNYHALKGGLIHLTRHLGVYWAPDGVRVNAISPGPFPHEKLKGDMPEFIRRLEGKCPMGRMGLPHELKGAALFLASDASSYVTGQNIVVDGGWTSW